MWYLATPYTNYGGGHRPGSPEARDAAHLEACRSLAALCRAGLDVFCPIAHFHTAARVGGIDPAYGPRWAVINAAFMDRCEDGVIVCTMEGWQESAGVRDEVDRFRLTGRTVAYAAPGSASLLAFPPPATPPGAAGTADEETPDAS